ncbi:MAG: DNA adenine methylase [Bacteroidales bacterium]|nr:DNA adenine methylase [Bacteroidales bacterium]
MKNGIARSPLFYVGDKYKLVREIRSHFPDHIKRLIEPFVGGGSVMLNVEADHYLLNDINSYVIGLHRMLQGYIGREEELMNALCAIVDDYGLSLSLRSDVVQKDLKIVYPKTYYARYNKAGYQRMKADFIAGGQQDMQRLYLLLIYGFNHMLRFNGKGQFNLPVGNVDFNQNVRDALHYYLQLLSQKRTEWFNEDYRQFLADIDYQEVKKLQI